MISNQTIKTGSLVLISTLVMSISLLRGKDFPDFPQKAIHFEEADKLEGGRYATCTMTVNTDGTFVGDFKAENMVALPGCHITGILEFFAPNGNLLARIHMPLLGLTPALINEKSERHADFSGAIKPDQIGNIRTIKFTGFMNEIPGTFKEDIKTLKEGIKFNDKDK